MPDDTLPPVAAALDQLGVAYRLFTHPGPVNSLEQAAKERGQRPEQIVRSILFRLGQERFAMVLVAGPAQVDWKTLCADILDNRFRRRPPLRRCRQ